MGPEPERRKFIIKAENKSYYYTISVGLGVPGLSVLTDLESPTVSENEPDLFLAAFMGTLRELLLDISEDILLF